ncbi:hypothetical protein J6590_031563 [Homalodisca vitripennis]|nr:hypothetical protein J6590_031563 [Homalodisca vitripennis]
MEEIIYETPLHDDNQEEILLSLSGELNILAVNNPDVDFEALFVHITSLLRFLDLLNVECKKKQDDLQALSAEVIVLESKLNLEKDLRQEEKDTSFRIQDQAASEMRSLSQRIETLHASLRQLDLHISSITAEKDSYKLKLDDTSNSIKTLKFENENKNKCIENLNLKFDLAKKEISNLKQMTTDKWLDDNIIHDYFSSTQSSVGDMGQCLFVSPSVSHLIKKDSNTALDLLKSPSYQACNYVFVAVSDILGEANVGNGSHWSLVFIDKSRHQAYHLDSIVTFNDLPALTTVTNLKIPPENLISLDVMCNNFGVMFVEANCWVKKQHLARDGRHLNRRGSHQLETLFSEVFSVAFGLKKGYDTVGVIPGLDENASKEPILPEEVPCSPSDITQGEHFLEDLSQMTLPL